MTVSHWIGGTQVAATGPTQPILDPATGQQIGSVALADARSSTTPYGTRPGPLATGRAHRWPSAPRSCTRSASCSSRTPTSWRASSAASTARRCRTPPARSHVAASRSSSRAGSPRTSRATTRRTPRVASTSTASGSPSASSPASRPSTSPRWCRCGCIRSPSPRATRSSSSRASATPRRPTSSPGCTRRPVCPTACSRSSTAARTPSTRSWPTPASRPSPSWGRRRSPGTYRPRASLPASVYRPSAAPTTTRSSCPTPT